MSTNIKQRGFRPSGTHKDTIFISQDSKCYQFLVEKVDDDLFELSTMIIDDDDKRTEYVLHCHSQGLASLRDSIDFVLKQ